MTTKWRKRKERDDNDNDEKRRTTKKKEAENENVDDDGADLEMTEEEKAMMEITETEIMEEMEYDLLSYLSIPQILFHHNLKSVYESHPDSKLLHRLHQKYNALHDAEAMDDGHSLHQGDPERSRWLDNVEIEMYFVGIPFVANALQNVCSICRIP